MSLVLSLPIKILKALLVAVSPTQRFEGILSLIWVLQREVKSTDIFLNEGRVVLVNEVLMHPIRILLSLDIPEV